MLVFAISASSALYIAVLDLFFQGLLGLHRGQQDT